MIIMTLFGRNQVTEAIAPRYFSIIKHPMDLSTIKSKISSTYKNFADFDNDVKLMLDNCIRYNGQGSALAMVSSCKQSYYIFVLLFCDYHTLLCVLVIRINTNEMEWQTKCFSQ